MISFREFVDFSRTTLRLKIPKQDLYDLWRQLDINGSGVINFSEFTSAIFPNVDLDALAESAASAGEIKMLTAQGNEEEDEQGGDNKQSFDSETFNLNAKLRAAKAMDSEAERSTSTKQEDTHDTLTKLLASMSSLQASMESVTARMTAAEAGQEVLLKRFGAVEALLLAKQQRLYTRVSAQEGDTASAATKDGPTDAMRRRKSRRNTQPLPVASTETLPIVPSAASSADPLADPLAS